MAMKKLAPQTASRRGELLAVGGEAEGVRIGVGEDIRGRVSVVRTLLQLAHLVPVGQLGCDVHGHPVCPLAHDDDQHKSTKRFVDRIPQPWLTFLSSIPPFCSPTSLIF